MRCKRLGEEMRRLEMWKRRKEKWMEECVDGGRGEEEEWRWVGLGEEVRGLEKGGGREERG